MHDGGGDLLGTLELTLRGNEYVQVTDAFDQVTSSSVDDGYAVVRTTTSGARFFGYASVVDNRSGDPVYLPAMKRE